MLQDLCKHAAQLAMDEGEIESIRCLAVTLMTMSDISTYMKRLGGPTRYVNILQKILDTCFAGSDCCGMGCQLNLLDVTCRAIAQLSFSREGQAALIQTHGARSLFGVLGREVNVHTYICAVHMANDALKWNVQCDMLSNL